MYFLESSHNDTKKFIASDGAISDNLGWNVSIYGTSIVVGAHYEDPNDINSAGSSYIFNKLNTKDSLLNSIKNKTKPNIIR